MRATLLFLAAVALVPTSARAQTEQPRHHNAPRAAGLVVIDGNLDEATWLAAPWTEPFVDIRGEGFPQPLFETRAKIAWDDTHLYVAARLEEPHLWATLTERDAIIYHDHDFEIFLDPNGDGLAYYEFEINALGTEFDLFLNRPYSDGGRAFIDWDMPGLRSAVHLDGTLNDSSDEDRAWTVEVAIPWADLVPPEDWEGWTGAETRTASQGRKPPRGDMVPDPGDTWRMNFSRVHWPLEIVDGTYLKRVEPTPEDPHPEWNWVWSPQREINMHIPEMWGGVTFTGAPPREDSP